MKTDREYKINSEYVCSVDTMNEDDWNCIVPMFSDATINQTWTWCHEMSKKNSHLVIRKNGILVAAVMLRLLSLPILKTGIAYIGSGPMWQLNGTEVDTSILQHLIHALRIEYVLYRGLYLRISPNIFTNIPLNQRILSEFEKEKYKRKDLVEQTLFLDLQPSELDLRKGLHPKWRNLLNRGEKTGLSVRIGKEYELFKIFKGIYEEMLVRKNYPGAIDINKIERIQSALPEKLKYTIIISELEDRPMAGGIFSTIGDTGVYILGATSYEGKKNSASYIVQWEMIKWMKKHGLRLYNLGGCSPEKIPETYHFKSGICGKNPTIHKRIGIMYSCENPLSSIAFNSGMFVQKLLAFLKK
jgi:lipid II:glycine glycyltransferase (peptidoglycan interpeptide bridge formation enzyme)